MTILVTKEYKDKKLCRWVSPGEKLTVTAERGRQIVAAGYAQDVTGKDEEE